ncbi:MAG: geranylgeranylglyceryl/heptaprenylglyceryl phosphate synthase [Flavobacteriales bacterium]
MNVYNHITAIQSTKKRGLAVLLDPDKLGDFAKRKHIISMASECGVDLFLVGGSLMTEDHLNACFNDIKALTSIPSVLFPGSPVQLRKGANAVLFLSLISGRNPELLIGQHVVAAPLIKQYGLEAISTGYMLVDCGQSTTASYISGTQPLPYDKPEIAAATALASEMLGQKLFYLDGGSGAAKPVSSAMISAVRKSVKGPLVVGGGIKSAEHADAAYEAGANLLVIGTAFEENPDLIFDINAVREQA